MTVHEHTDLNLAHERLALEYLETALGWPAEERDRRLADALGHDKALLKDVRELLLASQAVNVVMPTALPITTVREPDAPPPERLGPYRVKELLGQGGMGSVYRAERADGAFERSVAVKLVRSTRAAELVAAQFGRERRILAGLQHRNIAQLLDAGVTADGRSYFVMELVTGRLITDYATELNLSLRDTLLLYLQVCRAVRFAHARLVVHADIKPTNIIVESDGSAKLLDFGVARMLEDAEDGGGPAFPIALTPGYASPARQKGERPTTADDVFSLGVLLRDLLERFPDAPADLRAVIDRARAQSTEERYASVEALQTDIERWLGSFPVRAYRSGSWQYAARKFVARHRVAVIAAGTALIMITAAVLALAVMYARAEHARARAEARFADLRSFSRFVLFDVYDRLESTPRALPVRRDLAEASQGYLDRLARDPEATPAVRLDVIEGLRRLAQVQASPGAPSVSNPELARRNLDRAEALARTLPPEVSREDRALTLARLAISRVRFTAGLESDFDGAMKTVDEATARLAEAAAIAPGNPEVAKLRSDLAVEKADTLQWQGKYAESMQVAQAALAQIDLNVKRTPAEQDAIDLLRSRLLDIYAEGLYYTEDAARSVPAYREEMEILREAYAKHPDSLPAARRFMRSEWALGEALLEVDGGVAEAERLFADAAFRMKELILLEPRDRDLVRMGIIVTTAHSRALSTLGRYSEALPLMEQSVAARKRIWDESPQDWSAARDYAIGIASLGQVRLEAKQKAAGCAAYAESLAVFDKIRAAGKGAQLDEDHTVRLNKEALSKASCPKPPGD